jgi:hypothetical protein
MNLPTEPEGKPKVIGWRMVHRRFGWSIFGRSLP